MHFFLWLNNELLYGYVLPHSHANKVFEISLFLFILDLLQSDIVFIFVL